LTWRYIAKVKHESTDSNALIHDDSLPEVDKELGERQYWDIAGQWTINKTFSLRAGINNLFDKDPPIVSGPAADASIFGNGNTFPQTYDTLGRLVFMNLTMKF
jgi:outer membrane receptor protein involved in Fe transport